MTELAHAWNSLDIYEKLCKVLDIDTKGVYKVTIEMEVGKPFTVRIKRWLLKNDYETFVDELKKYEIKEQNEHRGNTTRR